MDYQEDINLPIKNLGVAHWVTEILPNTMAINNSMRIIGSTFDGWRGFGNEYDSSYIGKVIFISSSHKSVHDVEIFASHVHNKGWIWNMSTNALIPDRPFLISNRVEIDITFNEQVNLLPQGAAEKSKEVNGNYFMSPVIVNTQDFDLLKIRDKLTHLLVFSEPQKEQIIEEFPLQFPGNDFVIGYAKKSENYSL